MTNLLDLAGACERATGADRELDALICQAVGAWSQRGFSQRQGIRPKGSPQITLADYLKDGIAKRYTASIDAAMLLVPEGWECALYWGVEAMKPEAQLETWQMRRDMGELFEPIRGASTTPALALTAAALKALATLEKE